MAISIVNVIVFSFLFSGCSCQPNTTLLWYVHVWPGLHVSPELQNEPLHSQVQFYLSGSGWRHRIRDLGSCKVSWARIKGFSRGPNQP